MKLHAGTSNYAVAFEFHDDVVSLDNADSPAAATFYQLKTKKTGNWTLKQIAYRKSGAKGSKEPSFAGKMFENVKRFESAVGALFFVSNQACSDLGDNHGDYSFSCAKAEKLKEFTDLLSAEDVRFKPDEVGMFNFSYSDLQLGSYDRTILADIAEFVTDQTGISEANFRSFGLMLNDECRKRSKKLSDVGDFSSLLSSKFITRANMTHWLTVFKDQYTRRVEWSDVAPYIPDHVRARSIHAQLEKYETVRRQRIGVAALKFQNKVREIALSKVKSSGALLEIIDAALPEVRRIKGQWDPLASDEYLEGIIVYEYWRS